MSASSYDRALALVLVSEGGFSDNPADPGGATKYGITLATLRAWSGMAVSVDDVRNLTQAQAAAIYRANYWNIVNGDDLPAGVDYAVFDFAVNSGPGTAARFLQRCLVITDDGKIGPLTLKAASQVRPADLINSLCDKRLGYLRALGTWSVFGAGWSARIARVRADALKMVEAPPSTPAPQPIVILPSAPRPQPDAPIVTSAAPGFWASVFNFFAALFAAIFPRQ